ncbi:HU family DNA-binding protein [Nostoc sp. CHAB 5834]|nr:HU family DNA-binding protein [Nostoc sp. CHAB 5834]
MNKTELIDAIAAETNQPKTVVSNVLNSFIGSVSAELAKGGQVVIPGFGAYKVSSRSARNGRNPKTGETMTIEASNSVRFAVGATLKAAVNKS